MSTKRNRAYHNFFEGYTEYLETLENGKTKIRRVYTGLYYKSAQTESLQLGYRVLYGLLLTCSIVLFISASTADVASNYIWYTNLPIAFLLFCYAWSIISYFYYLPLREKTIYEYRTSSMGLKKASLGIIVLSGISVLLRFLFYCLTPNAISLSELLEVFKTIASACCVLFLFLLEKNTTYTTRESSKKVPDGILIH